MHRAIWQQFPSFFGFLCCYWLDGDGIFVLRRRSCVCNLRRGSNDVGVAKSLYLTRAGINLPFVVSESYVKGRPLLPPSSLKEVTAEMTRRSKWGESKINCKMGVKTNGEVLSQTCLTSVPI